MWTDVDMAVCNVENANSLVNAATEDGKSYLLAVVVIDEFHIFDDKNRSYLTELTITKLLHLQQGIQLIGMSATLSSRGSSSIDLEQSSMSPNIVQSRLVNIYSTRMPYTPLQMQSNSFQLRVSLTPTSPPRKLRLLPALSTRRPKSLAW